MSDRTWEDNAAEFAALDKGEGWPFARLVACSVMRRATTSSTKVSASRFAELAGTSAPRVLRYLDAWDKAAAQEHCIPSKQLEPEDAHQIADPEIGWESIYDASQAGSRPRDSRPEAAAQIMNLRGAAAVVDELGATQLEDLANVLTSTPAYRLMVNRAMDKNVPKIAQGAPSPEQTPREITVVIIKMKQAGRRLTELLATNAHHLTSDERDAVQAQIAWLRNAAGLWESCLSSGSMDDELMLMLEEGSRD